MDELLQKVIEENNYKDPEKVLEKSKQILGFLEKSSDPKDKRKYNELIHTINEQRNLKSLFDFYLNKKKEDRLKMFLAMQLRDKRGHISPNKKKKKERNDVLDGIEEEDEEECGSIYSILEKLILAHEVIHSNTIHNSLVYGQNLNDPLPENTEKIKQPNEQIATVVKYDLTKLPFIYQEFLKDKKPEDINMIFDIYKSFNDFEFNADNFNKAIERQEMKKILQPFSKLKTDPTNTNLTAEKEEIKFSSKT